MLYFILRVLMPEHPIASLLHQLLYLPCIINTNKTPLFTGICETEKKTCHCLGWMVFPMCPTALPGQTSLFFSHPNTSHHQILQNNVFIHKPGFPAFLCKCPKHFNCFSMHEKTKQTNNNIQLIKSICLLSACLAGNSLIGHIARSSEEQNGEEASTSPVGHLAECQANSGGNALKEREMKASEETDLVCA